MPPNPRLQRTRSALLRSPLSRKPLGRVFPVVALALLATRCSSEPDWTGVNIVANEEWLDATVWIDSHAVGKLQYLMLHDTNEEKLLKKRYGDSPAFHMVALNVPFDAARAKHGVHKVRIEKEGHNPVEGGVHVPRPSWL